MSSLSQSSYGVGGNPDAILSPSHIEAWGVPDDAQPRSRYQRSVERAAGNRVHQCPGCWAISLVPGGVEYECECGERLTLIDLRARTTRPITEDES